MIQGTTLETPPAQPNGGGFNSTVAAGVITTSVPLAPGRSIALHFLLGVQQGGSFRFLVNVEAVAAPATGAPAKAVRATKSK